jgi:hypothetical protein
MLMSTRFAALFAAGTLALLVGCEDKNAPTASTSGKSGTSGMIDSAKKAADDAKDAVKSGIDKTAEALQTARDGVLKSVNEQVAKVEDYAAKLKARASTVAADQKPEYDKAVASIDDGMARVKAKLQEARTATADQWKTLSADLTAAVSKLYNDARAAFDKYVK